MDGIRLELLGPPEVLRDSRPVSGVGRKAMGLIAYLATPRGRVHNRDELATLLWSDRFDEQARQSLRQTLSTLRKSIGEETILTTDQGVALAQDKVSADLDEFETLARSGELDALRRAAALYRGEFLEGLRASPAFDDWANAERRRLRDVLLDVLATLARRRFDDGARDEALTNARRLVTEEPAHEVGHRLIMQILAAQGHRAAALKQFEECKAALKRHLDAQPEAETIELADRIRAAPDAEARPREAASAEAPRATSSGAEPTKPGRTIPLHFIAAGAIAVTALIAASVVFWPRTPPTPDARAQCLAAASLPAFATPAVVVLPFTAEGAQAQAFADAITDRIGDSLIAVPRLSVVTGPPRGHADLAKPRRELATELGVTHVLDGTVRVDDGQASVNVRLIDRERGEVLWSTLQSYPVADRLQARDAVALEALRAVQLELTDGEQATHFPQTTSFEVLEHVFTGSDYLDRLSQDNSRRARAEFEAALAIDPRDPPANTGMAWTYAADVLFGWSDSPAEDLASAERYTQAATRADPDYFYAHSVRGLIALLRGDHRTAVAQGEEALRLSGSGADAVAVHALTLSYTGDARRSLELAQRAIQLRPYTHPEWYQWILARAARLNGAPQTAIACLPASGLQDAYAGAAMVERALALADVGDAAQARTLMETAQRQSSFTPQTYCAHPPYASSALTQQCVASLVRAGATQ